MKENKISKIKMIISKGKFGYKHMYIQYDLEHVKTNTYTKMWLKYLTLVSSEYGWNLFSALHFLTFFQTICNKYATSL